MDDLINSINSYMIDNKYASRVQVSKHFNIGYKKLIKLNPPMSLKVSSAKGRAVRLHNKSLQGEKNG